MTKKIIIVILLIGLGISIFINVTVIFDLKASLSNENKRINKTSSVLRFFNPPFGSIIETQKTLEKKLSDTTSYKQFSSLVDSTRTKIHTMMNELVEISGGVDPENGGFMNGYGRSYVYKYFYEENHIRGNARLYFNELINDYISTAQKFSFESSLEKKVRIYDETKNGALFDKMTIAEAISLLSNIDLNILSEKNLFLVQSLDLRVPTPAK